MLKKIIKSSLAIVVALSVSFPFVQGVSAEENIVGTCSLTIDSSKHTSEKPATATGQCGRFVEGYYGADQFHVDGYYTGTVVDGEKFLTTAPPAFGYFEVTVHTVKVNVAAVNKKENKSNPYTVKYPAPKVITVKITSTSVKGTTVAGAKVSVKAGTKILGTAIANKKGYYAVKIKKQKAGTKLTVSAIKGKNISKTTTVTVKK